MISLIKLPSDRHLLEYTSTGTSSPVGWDSEGDFWKNCLMRSHFHPLWANFLGLCFLFLNYFFGKYFIKTFSPKADSYTHRIDVYSFPFKRLGSMNTFQKKWGIPFRRLKRQSRKLSIHCSLSWFFR